MKLFFPLFLICRSYSTYDEANVGGLKLVCSSCWLQTISDGTHQIHSKDSGNALVRDLTICTCFDVTIGFTAFFKLISFQVKEIYNFGSFKWEISKTKTSFFILDKSYSNQKYNTIVPMPANQLTKKPKNLVDLERNAIYVMKLK